MNRWQQWLIAAILTLLVGLMGMQWQQAEDDATQNRERIVRLETQHDDDVARLDESNRTRRNDVAELEARIAVLEERTG